MKHISLIISLFLSIFHTAHAMETIKKIQNTAPVLIADKSYIAGQACIQAIKDNDAEQLELELLLGADVNYISNGKSLFYIACEKWKKTDQKNDPDIITILITHENIDVNSRDALGETPLHVACNLGLPETVASILKKSPQAIYFKNKYGCIPLHIATVNRKKECAELLFSHDSGTIDHQSYEGLTPLHLACAIAELDLIAFLIQKGACATIQNHKQQTPLYILFSALDPSYYQELLNRCDPNIKHQLMYTTDHHNNTQLHLCAAIPTECSNDVTMHRSFVQFLVAQNIDPTAQNNDGKTALDLARQAYEELYNLYHTEQLPYIQQALCNQGMNLTHFLTYANYFPKIPMQLHKTNYHIGADKPEIRCNMTQDNNLSH